jgi:hypothetical protein
MSQKNQPIRVEIGADKRNPSTRTSRASTIAINGPQSALWKVHPELETSGNGVVALGTSLADAVAKLDALSKQVEAARNVVDSLILSYDATYAVYVANVEIHATNPEDVPALGLTLFAKQTYPLVPPLGIVTTFDGNTHEARIRVKRAPGIGSYVVEVSPDPVGPATWTRLPGFGLLKRLIGYSPGTYWVRAASARANEFSAFTEAVSVIIK